MNAIEVRDVRKIYRRYGRRKQFATLKSALLSGRLLRDLRPDESFEALKGVSFDVAAGHDVRHRRAQRVGQEHDAEDDRGHRQADVGHGDGQRAASPR